MMVNSAQSGCTEPAVVIRECATIPEFDQCIQLQRESFDLTDLELFPRRHLIVSKKAGGWTLGAFLEDKMAGFVHQLVALRAPNEVIGYSHMLAVATGHRNKGIGAKLKWAQRERSLAEGRLFITWTWNPMQSRNAHFNLNRLGATVSSYAANFYGPDYDRSDPGKGNRIPIESDRLFADWDLRSERVVQSSRGASPQAPGRLAETIAIPADWTKLVAENRELASSELLRVRTEFQGAFARGLVCAGFERDPLQPGYLLYEKRQ